MSPRIVPRVVWVWTLLTVWQVASPPMAGARAADSSVMLFDTGAPSSAPLSADALAARSGWTVIPEGKTDHRCAGDVVLSNGRLAVVLRQGGPGAELYSQSRGGYGLRAVLTPRAGGPQHPKGTRLTAVSVTENTSGTAAVDATFRLGGGSELSVRYQLDLGQVFLKTEARQGAKALRVTAPCRFVVLPDFFADDIVVDAAETPVARAELPSENFLLQMLPGGQSMVMSVSGNREQDAVIGLSGQDAQRVVDYGEVPYGKQGRIWVAVIDGPGVWHQRDVSRGDAGQVLTLDWKAPYPAQWRVDWRRDDKLTDSWEMLTQNPNGEYIKHGWFGQPESFGTPDWMKPARERWTTVLGRFQYPGWLDKDGQGYFQPLSRVVRFQGPALIYPINRIKTTPLDVFTVVDLVRATLGVGPCEYILDVEGQKKESRGIATCAARDKLTAIYKQGQQRQRKAEVQKALVDVLAFVQHIRGRIEDYVAFGRATRAYLAEQRKARPELAEPLAEMDKLAAKIDDYVAHRKSGIATPAQAVQLVEGFRSELVDYEGADALQRCQEFGRAITTIGGNQDELVGECRMAVKVLRQRAALSTALNPGAAEVAKEIRRRTQEILRNPASYEAPRH